jgi:hypothetical protein
LASSSLVSLDLKVDVSSRIAALLPGFPARRFIVSSITVLLSHVSLISATEEEVRFSSDHSPNNATFQPQFSNIH